MGNPLAWSDCAALLRYADTYVTKTKRFWPFLEDLKLFSFSSDTLPHQTLNRYIEGEFALPLCGDKTLWEQPRLPATRSSNHSRRSEEGFAASAQLSVEQPHLRPSSRILGTTLTRCAQRLSPIRRAPVSLRLRPERGKEQATEWKVHFTSKLHGVFHRPLHRTASAIFQQQKEMSVLLFHRHIFPMLTVIR
jgi:hypothetical protein